MIGGVKLIELTTHEDERGFFREIFRLTEQFEDSTVGQLSHSRVKEGVLKAWHGHAYQSQWNYVVLGQIKVVLYDNRENSHSYKKTMEFDVGEETNPKAYFFPPGIMHGYMCIQGPMEIIYATSGVYDLKDEIRKTADDLDFHYKWK